MKQSAVKIPSVMIVRLHENKRNVDSEDNGGTGGINRINESCTFSQ